MKLSFVLLLSLVYILLLQTHLSEAGRRSSSRRSSSSSSSSRRSVFSKVKDKFSFGRRKTSSSSRSSSSSSSYPRQQYGSSSSGSSSSTYPKQQWGSSNTGSRPGSFSSNPGTYPKQQYGSSGSYGSNTGSYPKQQYGNTGGVPGAPPAYSAGGFVSPGASKPGTTFHQPGYGVNRNSFPGSSGSYSSGFGSSSSFGNKKPGWGSNVASGGLGAAGGFAAGSMANKYKYPKSSWFSSFKKSKPSYQRGYGTKWGTNFAGAGAAAHMYKPKKGISKKMLGLGVAAGFVGGAALGVAGTMASYSVMHRYHSFKNMMRMRGFGYDDYDDDWNSAYRRNECMFGCPFNSHCEWGYCECNYGFIRRYGQCQRRGARITPRAANFDPFQPCNSWSDCQAIDMNMMCNTNLTVQAGGKCQCKPDMKWNEATGECQMFLDVDCSSITYETPPSKLILDAVKKAEAKNIIPEEIPTDSEVPDLKTPSPEQALNSSLLAQIDTQVATANEMKEAFCRDVDAFSLNFDVDPERPPKCQPVPQNACGIVYDSSSCNGGWKLIITQGQISFPYFSSYWKYRNDIDLIGVQAGCTLTAFSNTNYQGQKGTFKAPDSSEFWWDLSEYAEFQHLDQDIESMQCVCTREPVGPANTNP